MALPRGCCANFSRATAWPATKFAAPAIRSSAARTPNPSNRTSSRCGGRFAPGSMMAASAPMATAARSARTTTHAGFTRPNTAWHRMSLTELVGTLHAEFGEHHYGRVDLELGPGQKEKAIAHFANGHVRRLLDWPIVRREDMDGIKCYLDEIGWMMVRASGTERLLRVYSETSRPEATKRVLEEVAAIVHRLSGGGNESS